MSKRTIFIFWYGDSIAINLRF